MEWKDRFGPPKKTTKDKQQKTVWVTSFPKLLKITTKERQLNEQAMIAYRRPQTLSQNLTNYRKIAHELNNEGEHSKPCGRCYLCGNFSKESRNMVLITNTITSKTGKKYTLQKYLTCSDFGIYVATCNLCAEQYVGQTITTFAKRWTAHRKMWNDGGIDDGDRTALLTHYRKAHADINISLPEAFSVTFVDSPHNPNDIDLAESNWINRLQATININQTILPRYR